jgi:hypothetical protein
LSNYAFNSGLILKDSKTYPENASEDLIKEVYLCEPAGYLKIIKVSGAFSIIHQDALFSDENFPREDWKRPKISDQGDCLCFMKEDWSYETFRLPLVSLGLF